MHTVTQEGIMQMSDLPNPRKMAGWEFFDLLADEAAGDRSGYPPDDADRSGVVEGFFISALQGCRKVLDFGCGLGWPGLAVAPHVGELIGVDAAPNVIRIAQQSLDLMKIANARFQLVSPDHLPFPDEEFDGAMLCGLLESIDWESVPKIMSEVRRVLEPGGRIAVLDQDWQDQLTRGPMIARHIRRRWGQLQVQVSERSVNPHMEVTTRYIVDPSTKQGAAMLSMLNGRERMEVIHIDPLPDPESIIEVNREIAAQFDTQTIIDLVASHGFGDIRIESVYVPDWGQKEILLTGIK
jgi:SAM-dependent methyltransferase